MGIALSLYDSDKSPLPTGRIEMYEQAWISSMLGIGGVVGTIAAGWLADNIGRKYTLLLAALPQIVSSIQKKRKTIFCCSLPKSILCRYFFMQASYLLIIYAQNVIFVIVSRFFTGFVGGIMFVVIPVVVAEVAEDRYIYLKCESNLISLHKNLIFLVLQISWWFRCTVGTTSQCWFVARLCHWTFSQL